MNLNYEQTVTDVLAGKYGNGTNRRTALTNLGYDYPTIQRAVNTRLKGGDWLSILPQVTTASTTPGNSGTNVPTVSDALNTGTLVNVPTYESGITEPDRFIDDDVVYAGLTGGYGVSNAVAKAYALNPKLGRITEKATNFYNNAKAGITNTGRDVSSAFNEMDSFQKIGTVANAVQGLWGAYSSYKNNKRINKELNFSIDMANRQYEANRKRINSQLEDRQARRHAEQPHAHQSVADYMKKYGV